MCLIFLYRIILIKMNDIKNVLVREATVSDYDDFIRVFSEVEELHRKNLPWKYKKADIIFSKTDYEAEIEDSSKKIYLAYIWQKVVWLLTAYIKKHKDIPLLQTRTYVDIDTICVIDGYRKQWIWKMLLNEAENWARDNDISDIQLIVREFNKNAKSFYLNHWFEPISSIMRKTL